MKRFLQSNISQNEKSFILDSLREKLRADGRRLFDVRHIKITFGPTLGIAEVQLGQTRVITSISAEVVEPQAERPTEGFYHFNTEFSPMADPSFESGRPSEAAIELGRVIERGLRDSRAIDTEALCIVAGEKVWSIRVDMHVVDNVGNLIDCASIATIAALLHFRRPYTSISGSTVTMFAPEDREPVPLSIHHIPICVTFGFFDEGEIVLVDPELKEETIMDGRMSLTLNSHRELCAVQKAGGIPISVDQILQCTRIAAVKVEEIIETVQNALKKDAENRKRKTDKTTGLLDVEVSTKSPKLQSSSSGISDSAKDEFDRMATKLRDDMDIDRDKTMHDDSDSEEETTVTLQPSKTAASTKPAEDDLSVALKRKTKGK